MKKNLIAITLTLVLSLACLVGCGGNGTSPDHSTTLAAGGVLVLSVNPEIAVEYDNSGIVTGITARNDDALDIINSCKGLIGQQARYAVSNLVTAIGDAGYFVEEIEGERRQITIEIEAGSSLPSEDFLDGVIADVKAAVDRHDWRTPLNIDGVTDYGVTDYGVTDYVDTDYGPGSDGVTDYGVTDYGVTDYVDTDYGSGSDGVTDYGNSDYGNSDYGSTDYGSSDYGSSDYGDSDYD